METAGPPAGTDDDRRARLPQTAPMGPAEQGEPAQVREDRRARWLMLALLALLVLASLGALCLGRLSVPVVQVARILVNQFAPLEQTWTDAMATMVLTVRLPRLIGAVLVGAALSVSGASYQCMFRNPIVSPDILGVAAGACVGAACAILLHLGGAGVQMCAFAGSVVAVLFTVSIPRLFRGRSMLMLVLSGVLVAGFMNSTLSYLKFVADPESELAEITYWTMGSIASVRWSDLAVTAPLIVVFCLALLGLRWRINLLALGDAQARSLGMNVPLIKGVIILCATALTSTAVSIAGTIGWVGLIVPHACRLVMGQDYKRVLPASVLVGGVFMLLVDTLCRTVSINEIPLSIFTGLIGVPLFVWLLAMQKTRIEG